MSSVLGPALFDIFVDNTVHGIKGMLITFADGTKVGGAGHMLEGRGAMASE